MQTLLSEGDMKGVMKALTQRDILTLLRLRNTDGSISHRLPPTRTQLLEAFNRLHKATVRLTVGARALCKHAVRCTWWGTPMGPEAEKNEMANRKMAKVLDAAVWINSFMLPVRYLHHCMSQSNDMVLTLCSMR